MLKTSHILQIGPSNWEEEIEVPKGLGWHYFSSYDLPSLQEYMEENEVSEFKALILDRPEDLLHLKDDLNLIQSFMINPLSGTCFQKNWSICFVGKKYKLGIFQIKKSLSTW